MNLLRNFLLLILLVTIFVGCTNKQAEEKHPNIVYILADDMGFGDVKCNNPNSKIPTPEIDRLASEGIRFTDGHAPAQICSPSRYSILTGRYYWRTSVYKELGWKVVVPWLKPWIEKDRLTLPQMLKNQGYNTACIGKWHLGFNWKVKPGGNAKDNYKDLDYTQKVDGGPITRGFDYFFGFDSPNVSYSFIENDMHIEIPSQEPYHSYAKARTNKTAVNWTFENILPTLTERATNYITENSNKKSPFFLYFPLSAPHTPIAPAKDFVGKSEAGAYGDFVYQVDWIVGQLIQTLKEQGVYDNTIIIFSSDNGSPERDGDDYVGQLKSIQKFNHHPNAPFRGMKADLWEGGHRVPFVIRWPGTVKPGMVSDVAVSQIDMMRTLASYLKINLSEDEAEDSYNILPVLHGEKTEGHNPLILFDGDVPTIRDGKWKLILHKGATGFSFHAGYRPLEDDPEGQLYNIKDDPLEQNNLYHSLPDKVNELKELLLKYQESGRHN